MVQMGWKAVRFAGKTKCPCSKKTVRREAGGASKCWNCWPRDSVAPSFVRPGAQHHQSEPSDVQIKSQP
jgi:hypothetical protein